MAAPGGRVAFFCKGAEGGLMGFGFSMGVARGRIGSVREPTATERRLVNISACFRAFPRRRNNDDAAWRERALRGKDTSGFLKAGFKKGDELAFSSPSLRAAE